MSHHESAREALDELARVAADRSPESLRRILALARCRLGMDVSVFGQFAGEREIFHEVEGKHGAIGLQPGAAWPAHDTLGRRVLDGRIGNLIQDVRSDDRLAHLDVVTWWGLGAYAAVPVVMSDGRTYGVLECFGHRPAPWLGDGDVSLLQILARLAADEVERRLLAEGKTRVEIERIRSVLADGALSMVFQPIIDLRRGTVVGVEALARFGTEPDRPPDSWFEEASMVGLGAELELLAAAAALAQLEALPPGAYLSVNVSPETVMSPRFLSLLEGPLGGRLVVEINEHAAVEDYPSLRRALEELRRRGARVAVDDTGAGFATLAKIHRLRPDIIKLDISLTRDIDHDPVRRSLVASLLSFSGRIGATVTAEGIETRGQSEALRALGVACGQGWFLGEPGPLAEVAGATAVPPDRDPLLEAAEPLASP